MYENIIMKFVIIYVNKKNLLFLIKEDNSVFETVHPVSFLHFRKQVSMRFQ